MTDGTETTARRIGGDRRQATRAAAGTLFCVLLAAGCITLTHLWNRTEAVWLGEYTLYGPSCGRWVSGSGKVRPCVVHIAGFELLGKPVHWSRLKQDLSGTITVPDPARQR